MYDDQQRFTRRHWYGILFLMLILGIIAIWQRSDTNTMPEQPTNTPVIHPEFALAFNGDQPGTVHSMRYSGLLDGNFVSNIDLTYVYANGLPVYQGDIILSNQRPQFGLGITPRSDFLWRDGLMPYTIDKNVSEPNRIHEAIAYWEAHTSIRFIERTNTNQNSYPDYVRFVNSSGCASYVGRQGGMQRLFLGPRCSVGNTIHEIGHALGLWHEHSRHDRGRYVDVRFENIYRGYEHNFQIQSSNGEDLGDYDYGSIMHYPQWAFSKNGEDTIVPLQEGIEIGQRTHLSAGDLAAIADLYD